MCAIPSFIVTFLLLYLPESPKFLLSKGKNEQAMDVFRRIYTTNIGKPKECYPVQQLIINDKLRQELEDTSRPMSGKFGQMLWDVCKNSKELFSFPIAKFTIISVTINFTFHIGYYGKICIISH